MIVDKIKQNTFYLKSLQAKSELQNINKEEIKSLSIYLSEHQMFNSQHHYLINNIAMNIPSENLSVFFENIYFSYNQEAYIHIDKIINNPVYYQSIKDYKTWFEESSALHYMVNVDKKIKLIEKYNVDLNIKNREGYPLSTCIIPPSEFHVEINPNEYVNFILKNKQSIDFLSEGSLEQNVIEKTIKILSRTMKRFESHHCLDLFNVMLENLSDKKLIIHESFLYKNSNFYFMQLAMKFDILQLNKTAENIEDIHSIFLNYCVTSGFINPQDFGKIDDFVNELRNYKIKKISFQENESLKGLLNKDAQKNIKTIKRL